MAEQQNEFGLPIGNTDKRRSIRLLPTYYRTESNKKFIQATIDQLTQSGTVRKIDGFVGRETAKAATANDVFISAVTPDRKDYQLEPGIVVKDNLGNVTFFKDYLDYINSVDVLGGINSNHERLNKQEFYSWNPHINWDKFVNFQQYYWMPYGPAVVKINGQQKDVVSTYTVTLSDEGNNNAYVFTPDGETRNPELKLYRGQTYKFDITALGEPFSIKTTRSTGKLNRYIPGVDNFAVEKGILTFIVPEDAPNILFYNSENSIDTGGSWQIFDIEDNTVINVETDIIGKKSYTLASGLELSNGMKVSFDGEVIPASYAHGAYYVEGVGSSIKLIPEETLEITSSYSAANNVLFDDTGFDSLPFAEATSYAGTKDYITINRSNTDGNPWSRYNRWIHQDVILNSAKEAGVDAVLDQAQRAKRPIIEFESNLKLFNFGTVIKKDVDLIDTFTKDAFSIVEGAIGYNVDGVDLKQGQRIIFAADTDLRVKNKTYRVDFVYLNAPGNNPVQRIHLVEEEDLNPLTYQSVIIKSGERNQGKMYWYNGTTWVFAQQKLSVNQAPLFDLFNANGVNLNDETAYPGSNFAGNKIFSYKVGSGTADSELGFALTYKNIDNIGDIVFTFNLVQDSFAYKDSVNVLTDYTKSKFLKVITGLDTGNFVNGWITNEVPNVQPIVRVFKDTNLTNNFPVDVYDHIGQLEDLEVRVYINGKRLSKTLFSIENTPIYKKVVLTTSTTANDIVTLKCFSKQAKNSNGYYELPVSFQNNPLNNNIDTFTLGEAIDHVDSIVANLPSFTGSFPGTNNLRDLGNISAYGTKFVQHSGSLNFGLYHLTSKNANIIGALKEAREDYGKFKRNFLKVAEAHGESFDTKDFVDQLLFEINKDKPKTSPYYFSDMLAYGAAIKTNYTVVDYRIRTYPLSEVFTLDTLSNKAVNVYLNGNQLLYGNDYVFNLEGFVEITAPLANDDIVTVYEYESTDGCLVPPTPTSFGLWPKYEPKKYLDTTLITPQYVIQGHDGSVVLAFNDYRDDLLLELEKRIFNNVKVKYDPDIFDINSIIPSYNGTSDYTLEEFNQILAPNFYQWTTLIDTDFTKSLYFDIDNPFTYNYSSNTSIDGKQLLGYWRGNYRWMFGTDRVHICPWESLGFTIEPKWWTEVYGPLPYTSDNLLLWNDLKEGIIREPGVSVKRNPLYARPILETAMPVDESGNLADPIAANVAQGYIREQNELDYVFGDVGPAENAWRRSSYYPFSVIIASVLMQPNKVVGTCLDRSRIKRTVNNQIVYSETGLRLRLQDLVLPSIPSDSTRILTAGFINYLVDYILSDNLKSLNSYKTDLQTLTNQLSHRLGGFTSKEKFNLILDSKNPKATSGVYVPQENYSLFLNTSSPIQKLNYSGVIITKLLTRFGTGYEIRGYSQKTPYFKYYAWTQSGSPINVGGISESYVIWSTGQSYTVGNIVEYNNAYYRVKTSHTASDNFTPDYYQKLAKLPIVGGRTAELRKKWDRLPIILNYGTVLRTVQEVVDFLQGYGEYLKDQGFVFDDYNTNLKAVASWETSVKEFLFWTTQNWSTGEQKYSDWLPNTKVSANAVVIYNGEYFTAKRDHVTGDVFQESLYNKLNSLSQEGASVIAMSPSALGISMDLQYAVLDDIRDQFNEYEFFKADGYKFDQDFLNYTRDKNTFSFSPTVQNAGIYGASFYLVQKEHVIIIDNTTQFNDTIYNIETGYRQERIRVTGYRTTDWYGGFDIPGFIFDQAKINDWQPWIDYNLGDIVKYKEFYYSAKSFLLGAETFDANKFIRLSEKPTPQLLPNWDYKAEQFTDFYDLESNNFDSTQQKVAQHLIGYQKRQYLENIIKNDVSEYKFYQGMIQEKGSQNVLNKLFDVLSASDSESIKFNEEWAVRVGQYGASEAFEEIEFILDKSLFKTNGQAFELVESVDPTVVDFVIRQTPADLYLKPPGYKNKPWPISTSTNQFLRTAGYVKYDQVARYVDTLDNLVGTDITTLEEGDYVWCAFQNRDWDIYRLTAANFKLTDATFSGKTLTITCDRIPSMSVGDILGITHGGVITGFHKIVGIELNNILITGTFVVPSPFTGAENIVLYKLTSQRASSINASVNLPIKVNKGELLWTDDNGNNKSGVWENNPVYQQRVLNDYYSKDENRFGKALSMSYDGTVMATSSDANEVYIYNKSNGDTDWVQKQAIASPFLLGTVQSFGTSVALSQDGQWLAIGAPLADNVKTRYIGEYNPGTTYYPGNIVTVGNQHWKCLAIDSTGGILTVNSIRWTPIPLIAVDTTATGSGLTNQGLVSVYKRDANGDYQLDATFVSPHPAANEFFGNDIKLSAFGSSYVLAANAPGANSNAGRVYLFRYDTANATWRMNYNPQYRGVYSNSTVYYAGDVMLFTDGKYYKANRNLSTNTSPVVPGAWTVTISDDVQGFLPQVTTLETVSSGDAFGYDFDFTLDGSKLVVSAPTNYGQVYAYTLTGTKYSCFNKLNNNIGITAGERFGESVAITHNGSVVAVGSLLGDDTKLDQGLVRTFNLINNSYVVDQVIKNRNPQVAEFFGAKVQFANDGKTLLVYSALGDGTISTTFDDTATIFDNASTRVVDVLVDSGRIDVFDKYDYQYFFSESLYVENLDTEKYGYAFAAAQNTVVVSAPYASYNSIRSGAIYTYTKEQNKFAWTLVQEEADKVDLTKIKKVFLYNKRTKEIIKYLDYIDPIQGKIPGIAEQELRYKTYYDPATYSVGIDGVNVDDGMAWGSAQVGRLWWNMTRAKFVDSYSGDVVYKNATWNMLYDSASIDIYEWVESKLLPADWDKQADTEAGLTAGISGTSLYGNSVYCVKKRYDTISKTFKNTYYFWVKNKKNIPNVIDRTISAYNVSSLISNPKGYGYEYIEFTGANSFSLVNVESYLNSVDVVLAIQYWVVDPTDLNIHTDWRLISENLDTKLPKSIEQKWIDSLVGTDMNNMSVPDINLPPKQKYGIQFRPRQSMFINRLEALKQYIERLNSVLVKLLIVDSADLSDLNLVDPVPSPITGLYDAVVDTDSELRVVNVGSSVTAQLTPVVVNGEIVKIVIANPGYGYVNAPYVTIKGDGIEAKIKTVISNGRVVDTEIINKGRGYTDSTTLIVRGLTALVKSDSQALNRWTIYEYNKNNNTWSRIESQAYNVPQFWDYVDWYQDGYNQFTKIDYVIDGTYQLYTLAAEINQIVKVKNVGSAGWMLLKKIANVDSIDYTLSYEVIARQKGTIKISSKFYSFMDNNLGFDGPLYDIDTFDDSGAAELRIILTTLKDKILVDELRETYLQLFFASLKYALSEQIFVDWAFKTSFVKAQHNVGALKQKVTYNNDNLADFESYINEVKPYRTNIREYISSYQNLDNSQTMTTDFDLPAIASANSTHPPFVRFNASGTLEYDDTEMTTYPWKHWVDNAGFSVSEIVVTDGGSGYIGRPVVNIIGTNKVPAVARSYISGGKVIKVEVLTKGEGYFSAPTIQLSGGLSTTGVQAKAIAIISNDLIRSNYVKVRFDRLTKNYFITELSETESFTGNASRLQWPLKWSPDIKIGSSTVTINGQEALRGTYTLSTKKSTSRGYTSYSGLITFTTPPADGDAISITYIKDFDYLNAADRINFYYNPTTGQIGKDLDQLMTGIDYGGVTVTGLGFRTSAGWDDLPWFSDVWDGFDPAFDDYVVTTSSQNRTFTLPYIPEDGQEINIYVNSKRIDGDNGIMNTFVGDGTTNTITLPVSSFVTGDKIIFRKSTSDGSQISSSINYDTQVTGGDLAYSTATGLSADDIIVDGDGFVTPTTSPAPEEVVPGQIVDTLAIKVYHRPTNGSAKIICNNFIADGETSEFSLGQQPNTQYAVTVKVDGNILAIDDDYTVDYNNKAVILNVTPNLNSLVSVSSFGFNGVDILDLDYFVGDGATNEYITKAPWVQNATSVVIVSGIVKNYILFKTDNTYDSPNRIGIRFSEAPESNSIINYLISGSPATSFSLVSKENIVTNGVDKTYTLENKVGEAIPLEASVIVRKGNTLLTGPNNTYYKLSNNRLNYAIPPEKFQSDVYNVSDFRVYVNGKLLTLMTDYRIDLQKGTIVLNKATYINGARMIVSIIKDSEFFIGTNTIEFTSTPTLNDVYEITSYYNHDILDIERNEYDIKPSVSLTPDTIEYFDYNLIKGGLLKLDREVISDDYVWVIKNGDLLRHSIDYKLTSDLTSVKLAVDPIDEDKFVVMTFSNNIVKNTMGYMQFKDMLNRDHYKRLSKEKVTELELDLHYYDSTITVKSGEVLDDPNPLGLPGIIYIHGERIEYYTKNGNVLGQLRRGTLGTGTPSVITTGEPVINIGVTETIPYKDDYVIDTYIYDGSTNSVPLSYVPKLSNPRTGQHNYDIVEVFVGGYKMTAWETKVQYDVGDIVVYGTYTFRCKTVHTSTTFTKDRAKWDFFVGNQRLKKRPYSVHNVELHYESPEGDVTFPADFTVDGVSNSVKLTNNLSPGTKVIVVKKVGKVWNDKGKALVDSNNKVANFLKEKATVWPR